MKNIMEKLIKFRNDCPVLVKNAKNPHFGNKYPSLDEVLQTIKKPLEDVNLSYTFLIEDAPTRLTTVVVDIDSGEQLSSVMPLLGANNMQQIGSAITYAKRYSILAILGITADDDDDGEAATPKPKENAPQAAKTGEQPKVTEWMSENEFNRIKSDLLAAELPFDIEAVVAEIKEWQSAPKGMKTAYRTELLNIYKNKTNESN